MELGFYLPTSGDGATRPDVLGVAGAVEAAGFGSLWVADHIVTPVTVSSPYPFDPQGRYHNAPSTPYLEPLTSLAFVAAATSRVRLVVSVLILPYRHPLATAKIVATVDVLSGGRLVLGVGVGWMREEFEVLGHDYFGRRGANVDAQLRILRAAWTGEPVAAADEFYEFAEVVVSPRPLQDPLPVWVGGHSKAALRRACEFGQATNLTAESVADVRRLQEELAEAAGDRPVPDVTLRAHVRVQDAVEEFRPGHLIGPAGYLRDCLAEYADLGVAAFGIDTRVDGIQTTRATLDALVDIGALELQS